ncbi:MAG: MbtH family protein [Acidobacteriota bacterium]
MSWDDPDREDNTIYKVVMNHEEQYSIWPAGRENPSGWRDVGKEGPKAECLAYIKEVWTDMRPLSLRLKMEEMAKNPPPPPPTPSDRPKGESLVDKLSRGEHPVEASVRPDRTVNLFKEAIDRGYVHITFTATQGKTELGVRLDRDQCDFTNSDFEKGAGTVRIVGGLTLDYVKVRCIAEINLETLTGTGHLEKMEAQA